MKESAEKTRCECPQHCECPQGCVTYIVVVHGIGEQRKNECAINVVNRFAEARRSAKADDHRDVLTLGKASGQTGWSKVPTTEQPWAEFKGIPASPSQPTEPFLGEPGTSGNDLRFVDICWSDVMQDSVEHVAQDVDLWAKGLLGRLLRKHEAAVVATEEATTQETTRAAEAARVPLWIRRTLYLLADTLLLVRFAMTFRFKEMKDLIFVKFLSDVELYGEYSRCRGQAVRRFHEIMAKVEAAHNRREKERERRREARYVVVAHSLGSIMSLDALVYASAIPDVRRGDDCCWKFPGYLQEDDKKCEPKDLDKLRRLQEKKSCPGGRLSRKEKRHYRKLKRRFAFLDTGWVHRVQSFVTLGSPIDKYLTVWWSNYRYMLRCADRILKPDSSDRPRIAHFNYCDELDPVGHRLDVVQRTPVYGAVFDGREDVVFNRYSVPGVAHNKYWTDQGLFRWILQRAVDPDNGIAARRLKRPRGYARRLEWRLLRLLRRTRGRDGSTQRPRRLRRGIYRKLLGLHRRIRGPALDDLEAAKPTGQPRWFSRCAYWKLLFWLYSLIPLLLLFASFASLSLAFQADGWRTAVVSAAVFSFLVYLGARLIDLSIWWRQIQRKKPGEFWEDSQSYRPERLSRKRAARAFRLLVAVVPVGCAVLASGAARKFTSLVGELNGTMLWRAPFPPSSMETCQSRLVVVLLVFVAVSIYVSLRRLPVAYRVSADDPSVRTKPEEILAVAGALATVVLPILLASRFVCPSLAETSACLQEAASIRWTGHTALAAVLATLVYGYRLYRFWAVKGALRQSRTINYAEYAKYPPPCEGCPDDRPVGQPHGAGG